MNKFYIVGVGPGNPEYILPIAKKTILASDVVIGGERNIQSFDIKEKEIIYIKSKLSEIVEYIKKNREKKISVIVSGDTGFYSMLGFISKNFERNEYIVIPGISSIQYMFSKIGVMWNDAFIGSVHGRELDYIEKVNSYKFIGLLTDNINTPNNIAEKFKDMNDIIMYVGENLSYENEKITRGSPDEIIAGKYDKLNVVIIENTNYGGMKDE